MLHHASTRGSTGAWEIIGNGDAEAGFVGCDTGGDACENIIVEQLFDDGVGGSVDNRHVGGTGVRSRNIECERNDLACSPALHEISVVGIFVTLALPDVACSGIVVTLTGGNLKHALDVSVVVGSLIYLDLLTACGCHGGTGNTGFWGKDTTVGGDGGDEASGHEDGGCVLHFEKEDLVYRRDKIFLVGRGFEFGDMNR